ncbi:hypothetical protein HPB50_020554 [Hyalomma asiaticum]|uniref:Uncharacterized protein n=1 Tax=Hyalomma asiaticum TaxID=266040 RepID=A0ACB7TQM7_HYAAI|nr:hypothetical protein HPB50_020554 [Hyalomma asiaticum]
MNRVAPSAAIVRTVVELMDSDSEDEEFDDVVTVLVLELTKIQRNRILRLTALLHDSVPGKMRRFFHQWKEPQHKDNK